MRTEVRPAFYAMSSAGGWRDYVTLLHPPYTVWHLSYVVLGSAAAPSVDAGRVAGTVLAFFLAVGLGAHALDELQGRPLRTAIPSELLVVIAVLSLIGALALGVIAAINISLWVIPFIVFGQFAVLSYNLELFQGRFHSDLWFGIAWGAFPALTGYWANAEGIDFEVIPLVLSCLILSLAQRTLSKQVRRLRRQAESADGGIEFRDGRVEKITISYLLAVPEKGLQLMSYSIVLLALGWLLVRV